MIQILYCKEKEKYGKTIKIKTEAEAPGAFRIT